ncbi:hypothetical protein F1188_04355 [Roseospira marina]|uniref:Phage virion morphogenesis protein n=1 Tax=Roseospira marina TaxID=140057 RepID=A0A5M6IH93_9PROT|nr:phage virion morphogenesis protein [Roseospira marina]KAA5607139.1 hypothetical protein F1188_04355 [Roseospira marina]MBB4312662.1 phage gpG-like protein [Roseospira marina]MBB5086565.1 phage gpG-like protein [Roseospira marina]
MASLSLPAPDRWYAAAELAGLPEMPGTVRQGTNLVYARIHQLGGTIRPKTAKALAVPVGDGIRLVQQVTIPARPYLGLSAEDRTEAGEIIADWITGAL